MKEQDLEEKDVREGNDGMMPMDLDDRFANKKDEEDDAYFSPSESTVPLDEALVNGVTSEETAKMLSKVNMMLLRKMFHSM